MWFARPAAAGRANPGSTRLSLPSLRWQAGTVAMWPRGGPGGSGPYFWMIAVSARAGNGVGGPPGTQDGTRGATGPRGGQQSSGQ